MKKIGVTADAPADLLETFAAENDIVTVPFHLDLQKIKDFPGNIFEKMRKGEELGIDSSVKTSQPSLQQYLKVFQDALKKYEEVIHVAITSKASGAYNSAMQAKKFLGKDSDRVHVLDSETGTGAQALLIMKIVDDIKKNLDLDQIIQNFKRNIGKTFLIFTYDNPKWLKSGGRFPSIIPMGLQKMKEMNIKLMLREKNGMIKPMGIKKAKDIATPLFEEFSKMIKNVKGRIDVVITHADNIEEVNTLKKLIQSIKNKDINILYDKILTNEFVAHAGLKTIVLSFAYYEN